LKKADASQRANRLDLANWLVSPEHPLTSRVAVNRFWQQVFGVGIVPSSGDFGTQGELPSNPELLDWLSSHFIQDGWNVKKLMKLMLMTEAFAQSSKVTPDLVRLDPENKLLARGPRTRLDAEQIRDNALFTSGLISLPTFGNQLGLPVPIPAFTSRIPEQTFTAVVCMCLSSARPRRLSWPILIHPIVRPSALNGKEAIHPCRRFS
jgi:hypothetical protein